MRKCKWPLYENRLYSKEKHFVTHQKYRITRTHTHTCPSSLFDIVYGSDMINYICVVHRQNGMINDMSALLMGRGHSLNGEEEN